MRRTAAAPPPSGRRWSAVIRVGPTRERQRDRVRLGRRLVEGREAEFGQAALDVRYGVVLGLDDERTRSPMDRVTSFQG
jgi:hypothetical protein